MVRPSVVLLAVLTSFSVGTSDALFEEDVPWLLAQRDAFFNWDVFFKSQSISGWDKTIPLCNWSCIECHTDAKDYSLEFDACTTFVADLSLQGTLAPELARCRSLYRLDLATVQVQGTLPADWGYPGSFQKLGLLTAVGNNITGTLPASWATPGAFPSLKFLWIDQNQLSGTLPPEWGAPGAFPKLDFLSVKKNLLSGTLPPEWALLPRLEYLWLGQNKLSGTLPEAWGQPNVFQKLTELQLDDTLLSGTLPAWDLPGAFPQLAGMYLDSNRFVGTLPNWKRNGRFPKLAQLDIRLNPGFCGPVPPSLNEAICYQSDIDMCSMYGTPQLPPCSPPPRPALPPVLPPLLPTSPASLEPPPPTSKPSPAPPPLPAPLPPSPALPNPPSSPLPQSPAFPARPSPGPPVNDSVVGASLAPPPPAPPVDTSSSSVPIGAIVGAVAGAVALAALAFLAFRPGKGWLRNKAARGEAAAADGLESGCKGDLPDGPGGAVPAGIDSFLQLTSIKQQLLSLPGSGHTEPAFDTFIEAKVFQPEVAFLATEQQPVLSSLQSVASASRGPPTPPAGAAANTSAASLGASAGATPRAQLSGSSQPTGSSISSLEGDALLSIIASHLSSRQPAGQEALQLGPGSGDSAAAAAQLGSAVQGWEVAWGDIEVERLVGRGAFGMVYLGRWNELPVAVKVLVNKDGLAKQGLELPAGIMRALQQEASVMARMRHPHVVSFLGLCTVPPAILTEYCPRGSVYENLQEGLHSPEAAAELTWRRRLSMAHDAAMGLLYLHRRGLIHRDIKSPNLLVTENWRVQVSDFNLAKILGPAGSSSTSAGGPGNPQWLAPEVVQGGKASAASDVFSFGMVLLELLTWRLPWRDTPVWEIARQLREGHRPEVPPPNALPGQVMATAPGLDAYCQLMRECWAQSEEGRPTFADIVPRLRALLEQV